MPEEGYEMLKNTFGNHFLFYTVSADKIPFTNSQKEELKALIDERDYFSINRFIQKFINNIKT